MVSLVLHELAHVGLVKIFGGQVVGGRLSLVGLAAWVRGLEELAFWKRYLVYLAGPLANILIAVAAYSASAVAIGPGGVQQLDGPGPIYIRSEVLQNIFIYNVVLCGFNLLPVLPLDGGRLTQLFLGSRLGVLRANRVLLKIGPYFGSVLMALGLVQAVLYPWNITLLCAGFYIRRKNKQLAASLYFEWLQGLRAKSGKVLPIKKVILPKNMPIKKAVEHLGWDYWAEIEISPSVCISEEELLTRYLDSAIIIDNCASECYHSSIHDPWRKNGQSR